MKKIILLAAFGVAGLMGAKESVENKFENKQSAKVAFDLCGVLVTYYNADGQPTGQQWFTSDQPNLTSCMAYQAGVIADLRSKGYIVQQQTEPTTPSTDVN
ncbi:hypothetical protein SAMN05421594_0226 [Chryseobacterium oleae]|uniref:Uncharacterized protein n=1 Tax=Chryseobacterium oleae TaxID=491207 RepID=A0A1I4VF73_CHROL|nr:hypothetical protein [Chryseobacterium oleae]SFM99733.1 hypothetical protein SAMN05421594_0226 [Chryseobacterium oleae]